MVSESRHFLHLLVGLYGKMGVMVNFLVYATCLVAGAYGVALRTDLSVDRRAATDLKVDLGYEVYYGIYNSTTKLNIWKG